MHNHFKFHWIFCRFMIFFFYTYRKLISKNPRFFMIDIALNILFILLINKLNFNFIKHNIKYL